MGSTRDDSGMKFFIDASDEYDAALIHIALEDTGSKFTIHEASENGMLLEKTEGGLEYDGNDISYKVIRFVIDPDKNPIKQGYELARIVNILRGQLTELSSDPELLEFQIQTELITRELDPQTKERFEKLKIKFSGNFS